MTAPPGRRYDDIDGTMSRWDRVRWRVRSFTDTWGRLLLAGFIVAVGIYTGYQQNRSENRGDDRDAARTYQRCLQNRDVTVVLNAGLDSSSQLRAKVERSRPGLLNAKGRVNLPDCESTYPRGFRESKHFPDAAPGDQTP